MKFESIVFKATFLSLMLAIGLIFAFLNPSLAWAETRPNDPQISREWYLDSIGAPAAWEYGTGSKKVVVAVLDTGVEVAHPDLQENIWINPNETFNGLDDDNDGYIDDVYGWDFINNNSNPGPDLISANTQAGLHHGTIVAGIIGAIGNNGTDGVGINWDVSIMPLRVLNNEGTGDASIVTQAINYAIDHHADIINMSFVGLTESENLREAIWRADRAGVLVVAAGGNDADGENTDGSLDFTRQYPACFDGPNGEKWGVIGVAALDKNNRKASFSDYGFNCVDISAPGIDISNTLVFNPSRPEISLSFGGRWAGTSLAAPIVSGSAALLKSLKPSLTASEIYELLMVSALPLSNTDSLYGNQLGAGKLNLSRAVSLLGLPKIATTTPQSQDAPSSSASKILLYHPAKKVTKFYDATGASKSYKGKLTNLQRKDLPKKVILAYNKYYSKIAIAQGDIDGDAEKEFITIKPVKNPTAMIWSAAGFKKSEIKIKGDYRSGIGIIIK